MFILRHKGPNGPIRPYVPRRYPPDRVRDHAGPSGPPKDHPPVAPRADRDVTNSADRSRNPKGHRSTPCSTEPPHRTRVTSIRGSLRYHGDRSPRSGQLAARTAPRGLGVANRAPARLAVGPRPGRRGAGGPAGAPSIAPPPHPGACPICPIHPAGVPGSSVRRSFRPAGPGSPVANGRRSAGRSFGSGVGKPERSGVARGRTPSRATRPRICADSRVASPCRA